jgi:hypothetical protein
MEFQLKDCRTGAEETARKTTVKIEERDNVLTFTFTAENCKFYCPYDKYNDLHSDGDICEILIGTDVDRKHYYEIAVSPRNDVMLAKMTYKGEDENGPVLGLDFIDEPFIETEVAVKNNGYVATVKFDKTKISTGNGEIFFNAYRIDTDGGRCVGSNQLLFALNPTMRGKFHTPEKFVLIKDYL